MENEDRVSEILFSLVLVTYAVIAVIYVYHEFIIRVIVNFLLLGIFALLYVPPSFFPAYSLIDTYASISIAATIVNSVLQKNPYVNKKIHILSLFMLIFSESRGYATGASAQSGRWLFAGCR